MSITNLVRLMHRKVTEVMIAVAPNPQTIAAICLGWEFQDHCTTSPQGVTTSTRSTTVTNANATATTTTTRTTAAMVVAATSAKSKLGSCGGVQL